MSEKKPRDIYIEFGGDPSDDKELYKRYSSTSPFEPSSHSDEVIHCREVIEGEPDYKIEEFPAGPLLIRCSREVAKSLDDFLRNKRDVTFSTNDEDIIIYQDKYKSLAQELAEALEELLENELSTGFEGNLYFDNASEALAKYRTAVGAKDE